ncbi:hypothetical protein EDD71_10663 [Fonticella tunisiensis]|uniref:Uncharacterized protein n=2 Tax=Fonticella tunisiensis TaxID=1096341 RepID=A0A4R7KUC8_9CLOT|nr:hypothetical protein EDD71_10663 [Fonticella tunisiensis]
MNEIKPLLDNSSIDFRIIEVFDTKKTKIGNDLRIINIVKKEIYEIYVAYF